jgi:plasmid maintenance system antidote protein VapI
MTVLERKKAAPFRPNYVVLMPPGDVLKEKIDEMDIDATELASRCKLPVATIHGILDTTTEMTQIIADKLEQVTWIQADSWMRMEENYRQRLALTANTREYTIDNELGIAVKKS